MASVQEDLNVICAWTLQHRYRWERYDDRDYQRHVPRHVAMWLSNHERALDLGQYGVTVSIHHKKAKLALGLCFRTLVPQLEHDGQRAERRGVLVPEQDTRAAAENVHLALGNLSGIGQKREI